MHKNWILLILSLIGFSASVEVHFEATNSGFFFKHSRQPPVTPEISNVQLSQAPTGSRSSFDTVLSVDRFTIVENTQPVSIRASYGPFSTKQTVPARYIVPMENQVDNSNNTAALIELQQTSMHLDISAHLVQSVVTKDSPILRVLFHTGADPGGHLQRQKVCVLLQVSLHSKLPLKGRCIPEDEDGVCVAEVVIPSNWWPLVQSPQIHNASRAPVKHPQRIAQVYYSVFEPPLRNSELCEPKVQIQPMTLFAQVPLISAKNGFKELQLDESISIFMPQNSLYPKSKFHVPVFLNQDFLQNFEAIIIKARVKSGLKILGATVSNDSWIISIEKENPKLSTARVTVFRKDMERNVESKANYPTSAHKSSSSIEIFSWLLEVSDDSKETTDGVKIVWSLIYVFNNQKMHNNLSEIGTGTDNSKKKVVAKLYINKDDIQSVLPMAKNWELMNTAVLTGRQVAQALKVFIVSQAGKVADVTLQSSCHADDESVIKVSSSCSSVYVDGSEIRGSSNASVLVKYGSYAGIAKFIVWMPEFPLEVYTPDFRLSQIKGWKVIDENIYLHNKQMRRRKKRSYAWGQHDTGYTKNFGHDKLTCKARYQQSPVDVYARFLAVDQNSGRISYFISRRTGLRITDLVQPLLRVADPKIASLKGRILEGKSMGRTDVHVLSPITGRVIGAKEIRVGSDKVSISKLNVRVVSGLQLTIAPDSTIINGYLAETYVTHKLTAQYQEGLLDIDLEFSDGSISPLRDIPAEDYFLLVESLDTEVVAFAPMLASHHPRVIAVGEGNGNLLRVALLLPEDCRIRRNSPTKQFKSTVVPLSSALATVEVDFNTDKHESVQNDGTGRDKKTFRTYGDLADIIVGIPLGIPNHIHEPTVHAKQQHRGSEHYVDKLRKSKKTIYTDMTALEVGMYMLLTAFCFAIAAFIVSCFVYASKFRPIEMKRGEIEPSVPTKANFNTNLFLREPRLFKEQTTNAHDWVWLGRSTLDKSSEATAVNCDARVRITSNPISNIPNECKSITSFDKNSAQPNLENKHINKENVENYFLNSQNGSEKSIDYRPPVPPHRCCVPAVVNSSIQSTNNLQEQFDNQNQWHGVTKSTSSTNQVILPQEFKLENNISNEKIHKTEGLVDNPFRLKKNAFQFDSIKPNKQETFSPKTKSQCNNHETAPESFSSIESLGSKKCRASVVGNPMFSTNNDDISLVENLTLDDLGMDYEQIMHYFDNLKESNA